MGGAEKCAVDLAIRLKSHGYKAIVISIASKPVTELTLVERLEENAIETIYLNSDSIFSACNAFAKLSSSLIAQKPSVVLTFLFHANVLTGWVLRLKGLEIPQFACMRVADPQKLRLVLERLSTLKVQKYICVSRAVEKFVITKMGVSSSKVLTIPNGIDLDGLSEVLPVNPKSLCIEDRYIIYVGRLHEQKRVHDLIEWYAVSGIVEKLVIVGSGHLLPNLQTLVERLGLLESVHLLGWQPNPVALVMNAECFVLPSKWEGMPNALLEAMAIGKSAVAFDVEGVSELLGDSPEQIAKNGDFNEFTDKLRRILAEPELRKRLGSRNLERVKHKFQLSHQLEKYVNLIRQAI